MSFSPWRQFNGLTFPSFPLRTRRSNTRAKQPRARRLALEPLEHRLLLSIWTYTNDEDFDQGALVGVEAVPSESPDTTDQLQLTTETQILPFIWVPNLDGTVSRLHTETGDELGRYRVAPHSDSSPSRTTVDLDGSCWVGNRNGGTVVKIGHWETGQWYDRNDDGICQTSKDLNADRKITGSEILPWGEDEAVLHEVVLIPGKEGTYLPGTYLGGYDYDSWSTSPRGLAIDANNNLWAGTYSSKTYYYIDGSTGDILRSVDLSSVNHTAYGALIDANGILWSSAQNKNHVLRLDPADDSFSVIDLGHFAYGLGIDYDNHLFVSGWQTGKLSRINTLTGEIDWTYDKPELLNAGVRGVSVTSDGDVWVASTASDKVYRYDNDGNLKATIDVGDGPTGVAVDAAGKVWVTNLYGSNATIERIDPATNAVVFTKEIDGSGGHYGYSDMTGIVSWTITTQNGNWTVVCDSGDENTQWGTVSWNSLVPQGSALTVEMATSNDLENWADLQEVTNGVEFATPNARYLQVKVTFTCTPGGQSPVLYDLTVGESTTPNSPPTADAGGPYEGYEGSPITLDASGSTDPNVGDLLKYRWDFNNDGRWDTFWSSDPTATYLWPDDYTGTVAVQVSDGRETDTDDTATVTVNNVAPQVILDPVSPIYENGTATLQGTITDPGTLDSHGVWVDWGDNSTDTFIYVAGGKRSFTATHQYLDDGPNPGVAPSHEYTINVTVIDGLSPLAYPVADWTFDNADDPGHDYSGNGNTAVIYNGASWTPDEVSGGVMDFDGIDDYLNATLDVSETAYAVAMWFKAEADDRGLYAVHVEPLSGSHDRHLYLSGGNMYARTWNNETIGSGGLNLVDNQWHHVVHTFGGTEGGQKLYIDGDLAASGGKANSDFDWQQSVTIGFSNDGAIDFFDGLIDDVLIYDDALNQEEVTALYNGQSAGGPVDIPETPSASTTVTVHNVAPVIGGVYVDPSVIDEGSSVTLSAHFIDPGVLDTHTAVVNWGDGTSETVPTYIDEDYTGSILAEYWTGIGGNSISNLTNNPYYPDSPSGSQQLTSFEWHTNWADNYGTRVLGYVHPPVTGNYVFWIASDDNSELWLSTDDDPVNKQLIASVPGWTNSRQWDKYPSDQESAQIYLEAGQRYYIEALMKEGGGGDNLAVRWMLPGGDWEYGDADQPIPGNRLSPFGGLPTVHVTHTYADNGTYTVTLTVTDDDGGYDVNTTAGTTVDFQDFSELAGLTLNGSAASAYNGQDVLRLTDQLDQAGSAFLTDPVHLGGTSSLSTSFEFQITDPQGTGADGIAFVIQAIDNYALGGRGGSIGYAGLSPSVAVEFDTYNNGGRDDSSGSHVGININGNIDSVVQQNVAPNLDGGTVWHAWIDYDGQTDLLEVRLSETDERPVSPLLSYTVDLSGILGTTNTFVGFTAATGGAANDQDIRAWQFETAGSPLTVNNVDPTLTVVADQTVGEGSLLSITDIGTFTDPGFDNPLNVGGEVEETFTYTIDWGDDTADDTGDGTVDIPGGPGVLTQGSFDGSHTYADNGVYLVTVTVEDDDEGSDTQQFQVTVNNVAPVLSNLSATTVDENGETTFSGTITDPGTLDTFTLEVGWGDPLSADNAQTFTFGASAAGTQNFTLKHQYLDDNPTGDPSNNYTIGLTLTDDDTGSDTASTTVTVNNVGPTVSITELVNPVFPVGSSVTFDGSFSDPGTLDTFDLLWTFTPTVGIAISVEQNGLSNTPPNDVGTTVLFDDAGLYRAKLLVTDDDTGTGEAVMETLVVIYDPSEGFVTGGGWIDSPLGAYADDPSLTGKANFGFVAKYKKGADTPTGQTEFQFRVADMNFHSSSYDWLVVAGHRAQYKGEGTINGDGAYGFMLTAIDAGLTPSTDVDMLRMKIWDKAAGEIVYDNQISDADDADVTTAIERGSIVIHTKGDALRAAGGIGGSVGVGMLSQGMLPPVVEEAIGGWAAAGVDSHRLDALSLVDVQIAELSGSLLGMASSSDVIWIDRNAAGYGWGDGGVDLLSVVTHELGHKLGFDHDDAHVHNVMAVTLAPRVPRLPSPSLPPEGFSEWHSRVARRPQDAVLLSLPAPQDVVSAAACDSAIQGFSHHVYGPIVRQAVDTRPFDNLFFLWGKTNSSGMIRSTVSTPLRKDRVFEMLATDSDYGRLFDRSWNVEDDRTDIEVDGDLFGQSTLPTGDLDSDPESIDDRQMADDLLHDVALGLIG